MGHVLGAKKSNFLIRGAEAAEATLSSRILFLPSERGPSAPVPSIVDENWAGVDIMS